MNSIMYKVIFIIFILVFLLIDYKAIKKYKDRKALLIFFLITFNTSAIITFPRLYETFPHSLSLSIDKEKFVFYFPCKFITNGNHYYSQLTNNSTLNIIVDPFNDKDLYVKNLLRRIELSGAEVDILNDDTFISFDNTNSIFTKYRLIFTERNVFVLFVIAESEQYFNIKDAVTFFNYEKE